MPRTIVPARDITHNQLFLSPDNEGNVICIRLKDHYKEWSGAFGVLKRDCGPYTLTATDSGWYYSVDDVTVVSGWATGIKDAQQQCETSVLLAVLGCLEFVD